MKTLHDDRKTHTVHVSIIDLVSKIKEKLQELDPVVKKYQTVKLVYPMGKIKVLGLDKTVESQQIHENTTLVLMGMKANTFDKDCKDPLIEVSISILTFTSNFIFIDR